MHKYFIDWYKAAGLQPSAQDLEKRWLAVETFNKKIKLANALDIVRIFLNIPTASSDFPDRYSAAFQAIDSTFSVRNNGLELRVLSAGSLVQIVDQAKSSNLADAVALAIISGNCQNLRENVLNAEIVDYAKKYIADEAVRVRDTASGFKFEEPDTDLDDVLEALTTAAAGGNLAVLKEPLKPPFEKLTKAVTDLATTVESLAEEFDRMTKVYNERSEILWWTFGGYSQDLERPFSQLKAPFAALAAGKELTDLVKLIPAPLAARAFLDKILDFPGANDSTSILDGVNEVSTEWKTKLLDNTLADNMDALCPLHVAIARSLQSDSWVGEFERVTGLSGSLPVPALDLSMQLSNERMLMRAKAAVRTN